MPERPAPMMEMRVDRLRVKVYETRVAMGMSAAHDVAHRIDDLLGAQTSVRIVFASAPSQNEFLAALVDMPDIRWSAVEAFHMDEYVSLTDDAPQGFSAFLRKRLFDLVHPSHVAYLRGNAADVEGECQRYSALLRERPIDIVCAGIGENGHMAFNDPHVADFEDVYTVKPVTLDAVCRQQQVNDGAFASLAEVPTTALTMTMPALMSARWLYCIVPGPTKTDAVLRTLRGPIGVACPATLMRRHERACLYLDEAAAARL